MKEVILFPCVNRATPASMQSVVTGGINTEGRGRSNPYTLPLRGTVPGSHAHILEIKQGIKHPIVRK